MIKIKTIQDAGVFLARKNLIAYATGKVKLSDVLNLTGSLITKLEEGVELSTTEAAVMVLEHAKSLRDKKKPEVVPEPLILKSLTTATIVELEAYFNARNTPYARGFLTPTALGKLIQGVNGTLSGPQVLELLDLHGFQITTEVEGYDDARAFTREPTDLGAPYARVMPNGKKNTIMWNTTILSAPEFKAILDNA